MDGGVRERNRRLLGLLGEWYGGARRALPWRETREPYEIWVSEVILQQTQVARGEGFYRRFLARFPDVERLAEAEWSEMLEVWRGLGYYQRARNMLRCARIIVEEYGGVFPDEERALRALPGIGPYTSAALLSFAFGHDVPAIDTNLNRIFQRVCGVPQSSVRVFAEGLFSELRDGVEGDFSFADSRGLNSALMDLGSQLCRAKSPRCDHCPLRGECHFARHVSQEEREGEGRKKSAKRKSYGDGGGLPVIHVGIGCIHRDGNYLLGKRSEQKGGNWEFPGGKVEKGESVRAALKREIQEEVGVEVAVRPPFLVTSSSDAEFEWRLHFCRCQILDGTIQPLEHDELAWVPKSELASRGMPKTNDMAVQKLEKMK